MNGRLERESECVPAEGTLGGSELFLMLTLGIPFGAAASLLLYVGTCIASSWMEPTSIKWCVGVPIGVATLGLHLWFRRSYGSFHHCLGMVMILTACAWAMFFGFRTGMVVLLLAYTGMAIVVIPTDIYHCTRPSSSR